MKEFLVMNSEGGFTVRQSFCPGSGVFILNITCLLIRRNKVIFEVFLCILTLVTNTDSIEKYPYKYTVFLGFPTKIVKINSYGESPMYVCMFVFLSITSEPINFRYIDIVQAIQSIYKVL